MKKVAAYCRVSTDKDIQQSSLELQMESYRDIISSHEDWELAEIYADEGKSGTATKSRKEFNRMIIDAQNGKIDYILAKSISRFARNTVDTLEYTRKLRDLGVGVFFEEQGLDTLSVTSEIFLTIHAAFAQEESHSISENMKHGLRNRVAMGIPKWSKTYGYRSENGKFIIDLAQASVVRYIFCSAANGMSLTEIVSSLKEQGIKSPSGKKEWFTHTVSMILRNERYIGDVQTQKTVTVDFLTHKRKINDGQVPNPYLSDDHEAIIDRETFERAGRAMDLKNSRRGSSQLPYYGYLKCPECGGNMVRFRLPCRKHESAWMCPCQPTCIRQKYIDRAIESVLGKADLLTIRDNVERIKTDWSSLKIFLKNGTTQTVKLNFDKISDIPPVFLEEKDGELFVNGKSIGNAGGNRIIMFRSLKQLQEYLKCIKVTITNDIPEVIQPERSIK